MESVASEASEEDVRTIYARVLAGEALRPGSFSLRTLEVLRVMDHRVAAAFELVRRFAFAETEFGDGIVIFGSAELSQIIIDENKVTYSIRKELEDAGLMDPQPAVFYLKSGFENRQTEYKYHDRILRVEYLKRGDAESTRRIDAWRLTRAGSEILRVLPTTPDDAYFAACAKMFAKETNLELSWRHESERGWRKFD